MKYRVCTGEADVCKCRHSKHDAIAVKSYGIHDNEFYPDMQYSRIIEEQGCALTVFLFRLKYASRSGGSIYVNTY